MNKSLILVVEDDKSVRNLITTTLKTHEYRYSDGTRWSIGNFRNIFTQS